MKECKITHQKCVKSPSKCSSFSPVFLLLYTNSPTPPKLEFSALWHFVIIAFESCKPQRGLNRMSAAQTHSCKRAPFNCSEEVWVELQALMQDVTSYHALYVILSIMIIKTELYSCIASKYVCMRLLQQIGCRLIMYF